MPQEQGVALAEAQVPRGARLAGLAAQGVAIPLVERAVRRVSALTEALTPVAVREPRGEPAQSQYQPSV